MAKLIVDTSDFILREGYLNAIETFIDKPVVKVLKGMRRVGKSVLIKLLINRLIKKEIPSLNNILYINKESLEYP